RYNTALNYIQYLSTGGGTGVPPVTVPPATQHTGGTPVPPRPVPSHALPQAHPARRCMMVLVGMSDPGLIIWPTHRVLGGMKVYSLDAFEKAAAEHLRFEPFNGDLRAMGAALSRAPATR